MQADKDRKTLSAFFLRLNLQLYCSMIRSRIAPTPSGYLHLGNAYNFILTWLMVRREKGRLRLRIDDRDAARTRPEFLEDIFTSLNWMELDWQDGPQSIEEHRQFFKQELFDQSYHLLLEKLINSGKVYACICSRKSLEEKSCHCADKELALTETDAAWRIRTDEQTVAFNDKLLGRCEVTLQDFVVRRKDKIPAYQVASLSDDCRHETSLIVRGKDLLYSTAAQLWLAENIGESDFNKIQFLHHDLIKGSSGEKLSKSAGSTSLKWMRENGWKRTDFFCSIAEQLGLKGKPKSLLALEELYQSQRAG
ncbi:MAG: glutamate--tRNA ligase family protein [Chitinophagales bacterium]